MGQCVTKCKNPSSSLGSKSGDKDPAGKAHCKKGGVIGGGGGGGGAGGGVYKEEAGPVCTRSPADLLANGTKKMEAEGRTGPAPSGEPPGGEEPAAAGGEEFSVPRIEELFGCYKDEVDDAILEEGMERFCSDLCVDPAEFRVLLLAWKFQAATMCKFTRREFVEGCKALRADSLEGIHARFPRLLLEARAEDGFRDLYRFTFQFGLDAEEGQRSLQRDMAVALWRLVFTQDSPPILERWLDFLAENPSGVRGVSRDTWNMFLNFTQAVGPDLSNYSEDEAWPSLFDSFVEWEVERRKREEEEEERTRRAEAEEEEDRDRDRDRDREGASP
ncbi:DCN1-like protein 3 [Anguilla anguilla]|uniref:DCN1-like protein 3 n=1 Tax=Anguilla anguilla TaxID=7936 RepID=UPI0015AE2F32|nr:DCN1-like protein 3 [Anguilla anguilla]XP_035254977.1 DCN1-like protein 3 [Anguilla anguilla]XP_035254978.1 DCN1-like protein 3 [Anguilla anguilla]XP_035254979.1 DCN1-like protein 3 [Anguilla anguilla]